MNNRKDQELLRPEYDRYAGLDLQTESVWLQIASELCSAKLAIVALLSLVMAVEVSEMIQLVAVVGIIGLGAWSSPTRWKHAKSEKSTAAGANESDHAAKREGSA